MPLMFDNESSDVAFEFLLGRARASSVELLLSQRSDVNVSSRVAQAGAARVEPREPNGADFFGRRGVVRRGTSM